MISLYPNWTYSFRLTFNNFDFTTNTAMLLFDIYLRIL